MMLSLGGGALFNNVSALINNRDFNHKKINNTVNG